MPRWDLPRGSEVFLTCPDVLFIPEIVFGGLVWILIASSLVPIPLFQGWVMFVSVFCFVGTTALLFLYIIDIHHRKTSWYIFDVAYHCIAAFIYISASVLEGLAMNTMEYDLDFNQEHYLQNFAMVFSALATLLYMFHACLSFIRLMI
uniref:Myelin and lymphocyte protein n=1 Tax=Equus caballus TaxID=9796 RepID=A0A3Q2HNA1_HORSE|nr:myelin and lymphocyte protein [Equus caballus]